MTPQNDPLPLSSELRGAVMHLSRRLRQEGAADELTEPQTSVLVYLTNSGPTSPAALSAWARVTPPSMNRTLNHLESAGLLARSPSADDRRMVLVSVTDAGRAVARETRLRRDAWLDQRLELLDAEERAVLARAATVIRKLIHL